MIKSMTGYGYSKGIRSGFEITVELKSVNNRYLETSIRLPRNFIFAEDAIKKCIQKHLSRGKVDVFINIVAKDIDDITIAVNDSLLKSYINALNLMVNQYGLKDDISAVSIAKFPDVLSIDKSEIDSEEISEGICEVVESALIDFDTMRVKEGNKLKEDILSKVTTIENLVTIVEEKSPDTVENYRKKLETKLNEILESKDIDESRIIQEAAIFADHIAVDEETVRLRSHISQLNEMMNGNSPIGRKADFLIQEFNREANTIGSKCQNSELAHVVVDIKSEIEKIREQVQNIE